MEAFSALLALCVGNSPVKGLWFFMLVRISCWTNNQSTGDLRRPCDVIVMYTVSHSSCVIKITNHMSTASFENLNLYLFLSHMCLGNNITKILYGITSVIHHNHSYTISVITYTDTNARHNPYRRPTYFYHVDISLVPTPDVKYMEPPREWWILLTWQQSIIRSSRQQHGCSRDDVMV